MCFDVYSNFSVSAVGAPRINRRLLIKHWGLLIRKKKQVIGRCKLGPVDIHQLIIDQKRLDKGGTTSPRQNFKPRSKATTTERKEREKEKESFSDESRIVLVTWSPVSVGGDDFVSRIV